MFQKLILCLNPRAYKFRAQVKLKIKLQIISVQFHVKYHKEHIIQSYLARGLTFTACKRRLTVRAETKAGH